MRMASEAATGNLMRRSGSKAIRLTLSVAAAPPPLRSSGSCSWTSRRWADQSKWAALLDEHGYARDNVRARAPKLLHISADAQKFGAALENENI